MNYLTKNRILLTTLITIYFLFFALNMEAKEKKITINQKSLTLIEIFAEIEKQTGYSIAYSRPEVDTQQKISLQLKGATVDEAMKYILKNTSLNYRINGYHIIVYKQNNTQTPKDNDKPRQTIRGKVTHSKTGMPVAYATVLLLHTSKGGVTDSLGRFRIENVPVGRYNVQVSYIGYNTGIVPEVLVTSSKEVNLEITLTENTQSLDEVIVRPEINKESTMNPMALTGGRMISMEEAGRFANGFDDPARLVSAFAGVAGNVGSNAISIRGNSPLFTQWRLEGVEIPNPTHFADISGLGGGFLSALSSQVMGNSDFYNGAFPAEYSNALSGVFDMYMRNGNNQQYEHTAQIGLMGIDLASEGPLSRKNGSSYIFNYRFSNTMLVTGGESDMKYHDLSFKFNFPTRRAGTFSVWGLGLMDRARNEPEDREKWEFAYDRQSMTTKFGKMAGGLTHRYNFNETTYLKSSLAATYSQDRTNYEQHALAGNALIDIADIYNRRWDVVLNTYINKRFGTKHTNRSGITVTGLFYDLDYKVSPDFGLDKPMEQVSKGNGNSSVISAFSTSVIDLSEKLSASVGLTAQYFNLNENWTVEPRVALKYNVNRAHSLSAAYGLNSRREKLDYYFVRKQNDNGMLSNKFLDFSRAHHFGIAYNWKISPLLHLKVEPYYQYLYNIPVEPGTSFSIINHTGFYLDRILVNKGEGRNYGIDVTLERYMQKGFYYMLTGSLYNSEYKGGDNVWRDTRLNRNYIFNLLAGKEWMMGKRKQNSLNFNVRMFVHGGDRYTPIDIIKSNQSNEIVLDETKAFSKQYDPAIGGDVSTSFRINRKKVSHEFSLKILNIGSYTGAHYYEYNEKTKQINKEESYGVIPNLSYKIQF